VATVLAEERRHASPWRRVLRSEHTAGWALASPAVVMFAVFSIFPIVWSIVLSFQDNNLLTGQAEWIGLKNYQALTKDPIFLKAIGNTLKYTAAFVPLSVVLGLFVAVAMNRKLRLMALYRTAVFITLAISTISTAIMFLWLTEPTYGIVNAGLEKVGLPPQGFLADPNEALWVIVAMTVWGWLGFDTRLTMPFIKKLNPDLGWFYVPFAAVVLVGCSNAVNLTDGLDGLAIGPVMTVAFCYWVFTYVAGNAKFADYLQITHVAGVGELSIFCAALIAASLGFLWYNAYPASMMMGDVGALALGGALGMVAVLAKQEIVLIIAGGVFVVEAASTIIQRYYFKFTGGKRFFRMAPLHHHFELAGWPETVVVVRFWIVSIICALVALSTLKLR